MMYSAHLSLPASAPHRRYSQFYEQPNNQRRGSHPKRGIPKMPRAKPEGETQAGSQPMRRGLGRRDYSSLKTAGARTGIPDHSCPPLLPLPHPPSVHRALGSQQVDPWAKEGGEGRERRGGGRGVTWITAGSQLLEKPLGGWTGNTYLANRADKKGSLTLQGVYEGREG